MLRNYLTIAWRNLWKNRTFTFLNLLGLTLCLASCLVIWLWVQNELSYDKAGANANRVARVALVLQVKGQADKRFAETAAPLAPVLVRDYPEIEKAVRFQFYNAAIAYQNKTFFTRHFLFADSTFFDVFGYPLLEGDPHTVLDGPNSVVLTESAAKKYFGNEDPVGKTITCNDTMTLRVTGVARDLPATNHFQMDMVCSFQLLEKAHINNTTEWWDDDYYTYVLLKDVRDLPSLNHKITHIIDKYNGKEDAAMGLTGLHFLQPLRSIHLGSGCQDELETGGSMASLRIFVAIGIFLLTVTCINYVNLTTATSFKRAREIGIRKVSGAAFPQLMAQFLSESVLIAVLALVFALGLAFLCLPFFNRLAGTQVSLEASISWGFAASLLAFTLVLGFLAGVYPALYLSRVRPIRTFRSGGENRGNLLNLRKGLVIFQFTLSVILIVATIVAIRQLRFMENQDLGFDKEQVLTIPLRTSKQSDAAQRLKGDFEKNAGVILVSASSSFPGRQLNNITTQPEGVPDNAIQTMATLVVDFDFFNTYKLKMAAGRPFSREYGTDSGAFVLNETAVREIGWGKAENAVGKGFNWGLGKKGKIIGVVKDFHFNSLQIKVQPLVMHIMPASSGWYNYLSVRINTKDPAQTVAELRDAWSNALPGNPFDYYFVDQEYDKQYHAEQQLSNLSTLFSILTIVVSCLGLFGLVMVAVARRTKEIGVRKVLGASVPGIATLLSKDFLGLVSVAVVIALPTAWLLMHMWLAGFAYHITPTWWIFALAAVLVISISLATVSLQAIRAALANSVKSLRSE